MFLCLENGDPEDPVSQHGVLINMQANDPIQPGYYVILNPKGSPIEIPINKDIPIPRTVTQSLSEMDHCVSSFPDSAPR